MTAGRPPAGGAADSGSRADSCMAVLRALFKADPRVLDWGVAAAQPTPRSHLLRSWIDEDRHAGMEYMAARVSERMDPRVFHPWAESAVIFAIPYARPLAQPGPGYRVAAYAQGGDYHATAKEILATMEAGLKATPNMADACFYGFVDTAPVFERDLASEAGLGWRAKNCCTLNRTAGSAFHLAGFFLDVALPAATPVEDFCGGCTRCIDQCPTEAFVAPGRLDANKCISYWTIEGKGELPDTLPDKFGGWMFGCDVCQEVCPWNHKHLRSPGGADDPDYPATGPEWAALLRKGGGFRSRFRKSPLNRAGRRNLLRNLAVAARNLHDTTMVEPLRAALPDEEDPAVRKEIEKALAVLSRPPADPG